MGTPHTCWEIPWVQKYTHVPVLLFIWRQGLDALLRLSLEPSGTLPRLAYILFWQPSVLNLWYYFLSFLSIWLQVHVTTSHSPCVLRGGLSWRSPTKLGLLAREPPGPACLCLHSTWITSLCLALLVGFGGLNSGPSVTKANVLLIEVSPSPT